MIPLLIILSILGNYPMLRVCISFFTLASHKAEH